MSVCFLHLARFSLDAVAAVVGALFSVASDIVEMASGVICNGDYCAN